MVLVVVGAIAAAGHFIGDWRLEKAAAMLLPSVANKRGAERTRPAGPFPQGPTAERLMNAKQRVVAGAD